MSTLDKSSINDLLEKRRECLAEHIYAAVVNPEEWTAVLQELVACTDSRSARMLVMNAGATRVNSSFKVNIDDDYHRRYVEYYVNACPWRQELRWKQPGRLYSTYLHFSCHQPEFYRSEFFNDWAGPQDIHHGICGTVFRDSSRSVQLLLQRTRGQGHYTELETRLVTDCIPHIQHSLFLTAQVAESRSQAEAIALTAGGERLPFLLLDSSLRISYHTDGAENLIANEPGLKLVRGRLWLRDTAANQRLQRLLRQSLAAADSRRFHAPGGRVAVARPDGSNLQLLVRPIHPDISFQAALPSTYVAVYLYDTAASITFDREALRQFYSFSKAETRVVMAMAVSADLAEVTRRCCISMNTLRSHLKAIFAKTATHSQAGLMRCLLSGPFRRL